MAVPFLYFVELIFVSDGEDTISVAIVFLYFERFDESHNLRENHVSHRKETLPQEISIPCFKELPPGCQPEPQIKNICGSG